MKRDGSITEFVPAKITKAIEKAGIQTGEFDHDEAVQLTDDVLRRVGEKKLSELTVESVQDLVELALLDSEYKQTAKSYILYREKRNQMRKPDLFKYRMNLKPYEEHCLL